MTTTKQVLRPAEVCKALLAALDAADGRRRKRKRDQTPDTIGLSIKRCLLERAVQDDPNPEAFEQWLLDYPAQCATLESAGAVSAMARSVLEEWRLAHSLEEFRVWLEQGAPSDDAKDEKTKRAAVAMTEDFADPSPVVGKVGGRQSRRHG